MYRAAQGEDPQGERIAARKAASFAEVAERYCDEYAKRKNKSWKQAASLVDKHLLPKWGKLIPRSSLAATFAPS